MIFCAITTRINRNPGFSILLSVGLVPAFAERDALRTVVYLTHCAHYIVGGNEWEFCLPEFFQLYLTEIEEWGFLYFPVLYEAFLWFEFIKSQFMIWAPRGVG